MQRRHCYFSFYPNHALTLIRELFQSMPQLLLPSYYPGVSCFGRVDLSILPNLVSLE